MAMSRLALILVVGLLLLEPGHVAGQDLGYHRHVLGRVAEHLTNYLRLPVVLTDRAALYRALGGFAHDMAPVDRDALVRFFHSEGNVARTYFGMETGHYMWFSDDPADPKIWYREPGQSGWTATGFTEVQTEHDNTTFPMRKFEDLCLTNDGTSTTCRLQTGDLYVTCDGPNPLDCTQTFAPCPSEEDDDSTPTKWCPEYTVNQVQPDETVQRFFLPTRYLCVNQWGQPDGTPGAIVQDFVTGELGDCHYLDGVTPLRQEPAPYVDFEYCGGDGQLCNHTYTGAYANSTYDPRFRPWYIKTRALQKPIWSEPFLFFDDVVYGITYSQPIYENNRSDGNLVFKGVIAFDYLLDEITRYLFDTYNGTDIHVVVIEEAAPHYVIALSSGSPTARRVVMNDGTEEIVRVPLADMDDTYNDIVLQQTFEAFQTAGWPEDAYVAVTLPGDNLPCYIAQTEIFDGWTADFQWRLVVSSRISQIEYDAAVLGHPSFPGIIFFTSLAVVVCGGMLMGLLARRHDPALECADWRFTCTFVLGCTLLNLTNLTLLQVPTDVICLLRSWSFHVLVACSKFGTS